MSDYMILRHDVKRPLPIADGSAHCVVTSPPYWGLRDYGDPRQIGLEPTLQEYVDTMVRVFREVRRVLRDDGTCWLNLGDTYASGEVGRHDLTEFQGSGGLISKKVPVSETNKYYGKSRMVARLDTGLKPKDLVGIPWRVAFALQADGWYLRSDVIWEKPNPMPESVTDRPTKAHEYVFLLTKSNRYYYDKDAVKEATAPASKNRCNYVFGGAKSTVLFETSRGRTRVIGDRETDGARNLRTVWRIATQPFPGAHFAVMAPKLAERCIKAGSPVGGVVFDPFSGAGTTGVVALSLGRSYLGCDVNQDYAVQSRRRIDRPHASPERPERETEAFPLFGPRDTQT